MSHTVQVVHLNDQFGNPTNKWVAMKLDTSGCVVHVVERKTEQEALDALEEPEE